MKKILFSLMAILLAVGVVGAGAFALFSDVEKVEVGDISAGTLDLTVDDANPCEQHIELHDMKPGDSVCYSWCLKNTGTIAGTPSVEFSAITNNENETNEPEGIAELETYASTSGELGEYLLPKSTYSPCGWTCGVGNDMYTNWQTGPAHAWGTPGLNGASGNTYGMGGTVLGQDKTVQFSLKLTLEDDLRAWSGTAWYDVNDNIIQSDTVEFDIIFHLDQAP